MNAMTCQVHRRLSLVKTRDRTMLLSNSRIYDGTILDPHSTI